ncbi:protein phosphatase regulatory subunit Sds22 [Naganishia albida]|nr:protein phosphatase regulatory subunit Sds22 [Naganishia albida]
MAAITLADQSDSDHQQPSQNGKEDTVPTADRPRARLGETEVVQLHNSDSEDEGDEVTVPENGDEEAFSDPDFLKDYPDDTTDLHLQHLRLATENLLDLHFPRFGKHLQRLCLRQNSLTSPLPAEAFQGLEALEELDFYDNKLGHRVHDEELAGCPNLQSLDLSYNNIKHLPSLTTQRHIHTIYFVQNKISKIEPGQLDWAADSLKSLELGGNRIRIIENLEKLTLLEELWLGKNKIRGLENLLTFKNLKILSLQSNRITKMENLEELESLEELYLSHNGLTKLEGLEKNLKLKTLDIGGNQISKIENISHLKNLEEFWANSNKIPDLKDLDSQLAVLPNLETVYLEHNPCQTQDMAGYRRKVILALPQVKQVDAT